MTQSTPENWEQDFDAKFIMEGGSSIFRYCRLDYPHGDERTIKAFINNLISQERKTLLEGIMSEIEEIKFGYEPPYVGTKDESMEKEWKGRVKVLQDAIAIVQKHL